MAEQRGETFFIDNVEEPEVHRSVQDLWRAQNAAWRARVLGQLRQAAPADDLHPSTV